uniref:Uncharacterized protein n=1 Tax=Timema tahoe TaxID=61484 RepID=A0A7R9IJV8_9NEOP|nr:unnamed protein product [Timema tahoe]
MSVEHRAGGWFKRELNIATRQFSLLQVGDGSRESSILLLHSSLCDRLVDGSGESSTLLLHSSLCDRLVMVQQLVQQVEENYPDEQVDWEMVHDAGCTCDDTELPHHVTARDDIITMINTSFVGLLDSLPGPPTIITISSLKLSLNGTECVFVRFRRRFMDGDADAIYPTQSLLSHSPSHSSPLTLFPLIESMRVIVSWDLLITFLKLIKPCVVAVREYLVPECVLIELCVVAVREYLVPDCVLIELSVWSLSSEDDYCPPEDVEFIQEAVLKAIRHKFSPVKLTLAYKQETA